MIAECVGCHLWFPSRFAGDGLYCPACTERRQQRRWYEGPDVPAKVPPDRFNREAGSPRLFDLTEE